MLAILGMIFLIFLFVSCLFLCGAKTAIDYNDDMKEQEKFIKEYNEKKKAQKEKKTNEN